MSYAIAPQTDVYLLKVPLEIDNLNQLTFSDANAQHNYFNSLPKIEYTNFQYSRTDGVLRIPAEYDEILSYNYVMYRNNAYSNKWFYAYITDMTYLNDNVTAVKIKTDVWQTWQFDLTYKPVLIDREHTNDDSRGANTLPEGLETGDLVVNGLVEDFGPDVDYNNYEYWIIVDVAQIENRGEGQTLSYSWSSGSHATQPMVNGLPSGLYHLILGRYTTGGAVSQIQQVLDVYDNAGLGDAVRNIYIVPKELIPHINTGFILTSTSNISGTSVSKSAEVAIPEASTQATDYNSFNYSFTQNRTLNEYEPVNAKLYTFPYSYFCISNNAGVTVPFKYEDFGKKLGHKEIRFKIEGVLCPSGSVKAIPLDYNYQNKDLSCLDYSITGAKYPMLAWTTDSYTNWLTQNAVNFNYQREQILIEGVGNIAGSVVEGAINGSGGGAKGAAISGAISGATAGLSLATNLADQSRRELAQKKQANLVPDQAHGNVNASDVIWSLKKGKFTYIPMCIKPEYAKCIDEYFSQYGYKTNRVKIPNVTGRRNWNYVRTIGCYIEADIPQADLAEIKSMFNNGITFWHNPATFGDYSQNNDII